MTPEVYAWVRQMRDELGTNGNVLDVGSRDYTGNVRDLFDNYIGLDIDGGPNVDIMCDAHTLPFPDTIFDTVCCLEMLEHDTNFLRTIDEIYRVLKPGGCLLLTARGNGYEGHDYPHDYWRFTVDGFRLLLSRFSEHSENENLLGIYGWGRK